MMMKRKDPRRTLCVETVRLKEKMLGLGLYKTAALMTQVIDKIGWEVADHMENTSARQVNYMLDTEWRDFDFSSGPGKMSAVLVANLGEAQRVLIQRGAMPTKSKGMLTLRDETWVCLIEAMNGKGRFEEAEKRVQGKRFEKIFALMEQQHIDPRILELVRDRVVKLERA